MIQLRKRLLFCFYTLQAVYFSHNFANGIQMSEVKLPYKLITGKDDATFCQRVSQLLEEGYELYGSPSVTFNGTDVIAAQAVILKKSSN